MTSATAWPTAFSRASSSASDDASVARSVTSVARSTFRRRSSDRERDDDRAAAGAHVDDANRSRRRGLVRARSSRVMTAATAGFDEALRLGARDERPAVGREGQPEELLDAPDVGHRLARATAGETASSNARRCAVPDGQLRMGKDGRPVGPDRVGQEHLRVEPRRLRTGLAQARDRARQQIPDGRHGRGSEPDRDGQVADLAEDLGARRPAPAVEQQVDRRLADPEVRDA